jgi:glycosyltransferase involved in cell wall biosynthesis
MKRKSLLSDDKVPQRVASKKTHLVSLVVPVFNEDAKTMGSLNSSLTKLMVEMSPRVVFEVIFIDDSTSYASRAITRELTEGNTAYKAIFFSRNFGKESALRAGLEYASGDAIIPLDADLQDPLELIPEMIKHWESGIPVVLAKRIDRSLDSKAKRFWSSLFYKVIGKFAEIDIPENVGDFRLMDRKVVNAVLTLNERSVFMKGIYAWSGFQNIVIEYARPNRQHGETKFPFRRLLRNGIDGIVSFSSFPLRIWSTLGFLLAGVSFIYSFVIIFLKITQQVSVPGYASLIVVMLFSTSINLICFGIFGEYISRLFVESKQRPHYIVQETIGINLKI